MLDFYCNVRENCFVKHLILTYHVIIRKEKRRKYNITKLFYYSYLEIYVNHFYRIMVISLGESRDFYI